jgi:hypothetical protein
MSLDVEDSRRNVLIRRIFLPLEKKAEKSGSFISEVRHISDIRSDVHLFHIYCIEKRKVYPSLRFINGCNVPSLIPDTVPAGASFTRI